MAHRILRLPAVMDVTGLGRTTVYEQMATGRFPRPIKLGERAVGWLEDDIQNWIETKVLESKHESTN